MALVTTQSKPFIQLVDLQQKSLATLNDIKDSVGKTADAKVNTVQVAQLDQLKKLLDVQRDSYTLARRSSDIALTSFAELIKSTRQVKSFGERIKDMGRQVSDAMNPTALSKKLFGAFNVGGVFNKKLSALDYMEKRKAVGDKGPDLKERAKAYASNMAAGQQAQGQIDRMKRKGASDSDIASGQKGINALSKVKAAAHNVAALNQGIMPGGRSGQDASNPMGGNNAIKSTPLVQLPSDKGQVAQSTTDILAEQQVNRENQLEQTKQLQFQTDLLSQIAANTALMAGRRGSAAGGAEDTGTAASGGSDKTGGGGKLGGALKGIGSGIGSIGKGVGAAIGGVFSGVMQGIADGIAAFGQGKVLKGVAVLGLMTGVMWGFTEVVKKWEDINWETITNAGIALMGLVGIGFVAGKAFEGLLLGAAGLAALGGAVWVIGKGMETMGDGIKNFVDGLERLTSLKAQGLFDVAAGLTALGAAFAAFGAGQIAAGVGNLVTRFLSIGSDSPVEQLLKIGNAGEGVQKAATGLDLLGKTVHKFANLDPNSMKPLREFPWEQATKFVAAGGAMSLQGAKVYDASKGNADGQAAVNAQSNKPASTNVSTAVQNNTTNNSVVKLPARNTESSYSSYARSRF